MFPLAFSLFVSTRRWRERRRLRIQRTRATTSNEKPGSVQSKSRATPCVYNTHTQSSTQCKHTMAKRWKKTTFSRPFLNFEKKARAIALRFAPLFSFWRASYIFAEPTRLVGSTVESILCERKAGSGIARLLWVSSFMYLRARNITTNGYRVSP